MLPGHQQAHHPGLEASKPVLPSNWSVEPSTVPLSAKSVDFEESLRSLVRKINPKEAYTEFIDEFHTLNWQQQADLRQSEQFIHVMRGIVAYELLKGRIIQAAILTNILAYNEADKTSFYQAAVCDLILCISNPNFRELPKKIDLIDIIEKVGMRAVVSPSSTEPVLSIEGICSAIRRAFSKLIVERNFRGLLDRLEELDLHTHQSANIDNLRDIILDEHLQSMVPENAGSYNELHTSVANSAASQTQLQVKGHLIGPKEYSVAPNTISQIYLWVHGDSGPVSEEELSFLYRWVDSIAERRHIGLIIVPWIPSGSFNLTQAIIFDSDLQDTQDSDTYARYLILHHDLLAEISGKIGERALIWLDPLVDFTDPISLQIISSKLKIDLSPQNRDAISFECFGRLPNECVAAQMHEKGLKEISANITGGGIVPQLFPDKILSIFTPGDAFSGRNFEAIKLLSRNHNSKISEQQGIVNISEGQHTIYNIGTGFFPFDTLEIIELLKSEYSDMSRFNIIGAELRHVPTRAHIHFSLSDNPNLLRDMTIEVDRTSGAVFSLNYRVNGGVLVIGKRDQITALALDCFVEDNPAERGMVLVDYARGLGMKQFGQLQKKNRSHSLLERAINHLGGRAKIQSYLGKRDDIVTDKFIVRFKPIRRAIEHAGGKFAKINDVSEIPDNSCSIITAFNVTVHMTKEERASFIKSICLKLRPNGFLIIRERNRVLGFKNSNSHPEQVSTLYLEDEKDSFDDRY
jgi:hypothetical protein